MKKKSIRHMVIFGLKYDCDAIETDKFLKDAQEILSSIPGVEKFKVLRQVSIKNDYSYGFSMKFVNQEAFDEYSQHPLHVDFVKQRWETEVTKFLEIDFEDIT